MYKKIISLLLVIATLCSFLVVPASAEDILPPVDEDYGGFISGVVDFADWAIDETFYAIKLIGSVFSDEICPERVGSNTAHSFAVDTVTVDGVLGNYYVCQYCGFNSGYTADTHGFNSAYNQYVSSLQTDLGTTTLIDGGIRVYFPYTKISDNNWGISFSDLSPFGSTVVSGIGYVSRDYAQLTWLFGSITVPFACYVTTNYEGGCTGTINRVGGNRYVNTQFSQGTVISLTDTGWLGFSLQAGLQSWYLRGYADITPYTGVLPTELNCGAESRPTSIIGDYGIIGDDGTIIHVEGNMIVDESTNTVYNPVTNVTNNYTDYAFDYSDRSYNLTLEDGSTLKVVYGDENVTIHEGDTIYNIYYLIPDDSGSGGGSDSGDAPSGEDMSWWKQAWTNFTDKLFSILGNGGSSVNPDTAPAVPDDEETGEKGYSIIDLFVVLKDGTWAFITGIVSTAYDGFTGFVESVSSAGSFFTFYNEDSENSLVFIPLEEGGSVWD